MDVLRCEMNFPFMAREHRIHTGSTNGHLDHVWTQGNTQNRHNIQRRRALIEVHRHLAPYTAADEEVGRNSLDILDLVKHPLTNKTTTIHKMALKVNHLITGTVHLIARRVTPLNTTMADHPIVVVTPVLVITTSTRVLGAVSQARGPLRTTMDPLTGAARTISTIYNGLHPGPVAVVANKVLGLPIAMDLEHRQRDLHLSATRNLQEQWKPTVISDLPRGHSQEKMTLSSR